MCITNTIAGWLCALLFKNRFCCQELTVFVYAAVDGNYIKFIHVIILHCGNVTLLVMVNYGYDPLSHQIKFLCFELQ